MEMTLRPDPRSWTEGGLDWNSPDPRDPMYFWALHGAFLERLQVIRSTSVNYWLSGMTPWMPATLVQMDRLVRMISDVCGSFINLGYDYAEHPGEFPRRWTFGELCSCDDCNITEYARNGAVMASEGGDWLRRVKNCLDRLHVIPCEKCWGETLTRSGAEHDPAFAESISTALAQALGREPSAAAFRSRPGRIYAWSGNTHWKTPRPDWEGDPEDNIDGYCGYAYSAAHHITGVRSWYPERSVDVVFGVDVSSPAGAVSYSQELATSVLDTGRTGLREGLNILREHVETPESCDVTLGWLDDIPQNGVVPQSDFDSEGEAVLRRSAKRGYEAAVTVLLDYDCENGFRFRPEQTTEGTG